MKPLKVNIITAKGCKSCDAAKELITKSAEAEKMTVTILELDSESTAAIGMATTYNLTSVPSFVINGHRFAGARHPVAKVREALRWGK